MTKTVHQLKATIQGITPPAWRRVVVPSNITFAGLHHVLQAALGWCDYHLHEFEVEGVRYGIDDGEDWGEPAQDERRARLGDVTGEGTRFLYTYDFGDDWEHGIVVESVAPAEEGIRYPTLTDGRRARPPEDCGGVSGYARFLDAIADSNHEDHESMLEWAGGSFDPDAFDPSDFERNLKPERMAHL